MIASNLVSSLPCTYKNEIFFLAMVPTNFIYIFLEILHLFVVHITDDVSYFKLSIVPVVSTEEETTFSPNLVLLISSLINV